MSPLYGIRSGYWTGNARPVENEFEDVVRLRQCLRRAAQLAHGVELDPAIMPTLRRWAEKFRVNLLSGC